MAYMLRALVRQSLALKLNNSGIYMSISRPVFTHTSFYPHDYVRRRKEKEQEFFKIKDQLKSSISQNLEKQSEALKDDLKKMVYIVKTKADLYLIANALKSGSIPVGAKTEIGKQLINALFFLKWMDEAFNLFCNKDLYFLVNNYNLSTLMYMLTEAKKYNEAVQAFELYVSHTNGNLVDMSWINFVFLTKSLYFINTKEALHKFINVFENLRNSEGNKIKELKNQILPCAFIALLSIKQDEPQIAMDYISFVTTQNETSIHSNLKILAYAKMGRINDGLKLIRDVLDRQNMFTFGYKKFFPYTIEFIRETIEKTNNTKQIEQFESLVNRIKKVKQMNEEDLLDILAKSNTIQMNEPKTAESKASLQYREREPQTSQQNVSSQSKKLDPMPKVLNIDVGKEDEQKKSHTSAKQATDQTTEEKLELLDKISRLFARKEYENLVDLFERTFLNDDSSIKELKSMPGSNLSLVTCSLLYLNSKESLEKMKNILQVYASKNLKFDNDSQLHLFLLAINQNDSFNNTLLSLFKNLKSKPVGVSDDEHNEIQKEFPKNKKNQFNQQKKLKENDNTTANTATHFLIDKFEKYFSSHEYRKFVDKLLEHFDEIYWDSFDNRRLFDMLSKSIRKSDLNLDEIKRVLELIKKKIHIKNLSCNFFIDIFLAIINKGSPIYALEFIADFDHDEFFRKQYPSIFNNLLAIGFSLIDRMDIALLQIEAVLDMDDNSDNNNENTFHGKLFPLTLEHIKKAINRLSESEYSKKYKSLLKKAQENRRINKIDLNSFSDI